MSGYLVDSNILLDVFEDDPLFAEKSQELLDLYSQEHTLYINSVIYAEISIGFNQIEELENTLLLADIKLLQIPKEALFLAGKAFLNYRKNKGNKLSPLPDFFIGAHAAVAGLPLITRDTNRYSNYFPKVKLVEPGKI